jgi:hypothetical protein
MKADPWASALRLLPHLSGTPDNDTVVAEYLAESAITPIVMIRRGRHKFIHSACQGAPDGTCR